MKMEVKVKVGENEHRCTYCSDPSSEGMRVRADCRIPLEIMLRLCMLAKYAVHFTSASPKVE